jgi:hypothetical protein
MQAQSRERFDLFALLWIENVVVTWSVEQINRWHTVIGEVVSDDSILRPTVHINHTNCSAKSRANCYDVDVVALLVHCLDFLVTELRHAVVASVDEVLVKLFIEK